MVGYGVPLEEVHEVEGRRPLPHEHRPDAGGVLVVYAGGAPEAAARLATVEPRLPAVEEVAHKVVLRALDRRAEVAAVLAVVLDGLHPDGVRVRPAADRKINARAIEAPVVERLEEGRGVQVVAVHPPDVVVEDLYGARRHNGLGHGAVDDDPPLPLVVPRVADDAALGRGLAGRYGGRRRGSDAREDGDRVPDRLAPLGQRAQVRGLARRDGGAEHVRPDAVEHEEQDGFGGVVRGRQGPPILTRRAGLPVIPLSGSGPLCGTPGGLGAAQPAVGAAVEEIEDYAECHPA